MLKQFFKFVACSVRDWAAHYAESDDNQPNNIHTATAGNRIVLLPVFDQHGVRIGSQLVSSDITITSQSHNVQPVPVAGTQPNNNEFVTVSKYPETNLRWYSSSHNRPVYGFSYP
ncbi:hypothetical protein BT96DRAFT_950093 [Gymnopus androsaceus JB14]|uniref:Uncharacterized protein n=1 Tax=Gymnopus androsaceus JB14 TaxID=1447944 RepID=A0A6A4GIH2_9AGAR|nr:hypothetical protein BT96DRAFT_950093 [Gymnopus androsaceus JB14]